MSCLIIKISKSADTQIIFLSCKCYDKTLYPNIKITKFSYMNTNLVCPTFVRLKQHMRT